MTKSEMLKKLCLHDGYGVELKEENNSYFYFYENFNNNYDELISRIYRHFGEDATLIFYTPKYARQEEFRGYMLFYNNLVERANTAEISYEMYPESKEFEREFDKTYKRQFEYMTFLIKTLMEWTNCSFQEAKKQIITQKVFYTRFK